MSTRTAADKGLFPSVLVYDEIVASQVRDQAIARALDSDRNNDEIHSRPDLKILRVPAED
ncbi:MAG: hypothetical protein DMG13_19180 [Acidobacteria bacterium]|nr:MAG: hypothetical protein DMG13_19180 [Acidobacteriota bacterium]